MVPVWKLDRFGRSAFDQLGNIRQLDAAGVRFVSVTQGIDIRPGGDPMSRLLITMLSAIAEFERDLIVEHTRLGLANARRAGVRIGRPRVPTPAADKVQRFKGAARHDPRLPSAWAAQCGRRGWLRKPGGKISGALPSRRPSAISEFSWRRCRCCVGRKLEVLSVSTPVARPDPSLQAERQQQGAP